MLIIVKAKVDSRFEVSIRKCSYWFKPKVVDMFLAVACGSGTRWHYTISLFYCNHKAQQQRQVEHGWY
ncbi:hypothetical protein RDI58_005662 [Solanum bulbocastanum]|uniref:Uncharacterized protein n=1 Tax=Solanum bulbocastanum TaxID=147425 RepID=A0AAN8U139_SOLBU